MKLLLMAAFVLFSGAAFAHDKTDTLKVYGKSEACKAGIEKAAMIDGVKKAEWNAGTQMLVVTYDGHKVKRDDIEKSIAAIGHDTEHVTADAAAYNKLPNSCKYKRKTADAKAATNNAADSHAGHHH